MRGLIACLISCLGLTGCGPVFQGLFSSQAPTIKGSGVEVVEIRKVDEFDRLRLSSAFEGRVRIGASQKVSIRGDDNLVPLVETRSNGPVLEIRMRDNLNVAMQQPIVVEIDTPALREIRADGAVHLTVQPVGTSRVVLERVEASGASRVEVEGLLSRSLAVNSSGASRVVLAGRVVSLDLKAAGAAAISAEVLIASECRIDADGASNVTVKATASVAGNASGAARIRVIGEPSDRKLYASGAASVDFAPPDDSR